MKTADRCSIRIGALLVAVFMIAASVMPAFAEGEAAQADAQNAAAAPQTTAEKLAALRAPDRWVSVDGGLYYFDKRGILVSDRWAKVRSSNKTSALKWSYFDKSGLCRKSVSIRSRYRWVKADGKKFYFGKNRKPVGYGFHMINDKLYFFGRDKALVKGKFRYRKEKYKTTKAGNITGLPYYRYRYRYGSFIYIDISEQRLYHYRYGRLKQKYPVVTGRSSQGWDTPTGEFSVRSKARSIYLVGYNYQTYVNYWMAFIGNAYGIHDATWRGEKDFRNRKTYKKSGSHGCVNMRRSDAARLYWSVSTGTPVIVGK